MATTCNSCFRLVNFLKNSSPLKLLSHIDDSYQVSVVAMFVNDRDEMSNLHRGHSIDVSYQVSVHLAEGFQRRRILEAQH
jgi:hypothetical protein